MEIKETNKLINITNAITNYGSKAFKVVVFNDHSCKRVLDMATFERADNAAEFVKTHAEGADITLPNGQYTSIKNLKRVLELMI